LDSEEIMLAYVSRSTLTGSEAEVRAEIKSILAAARRKNTAKSVTGALVFNADGFAQVLEGSKACVDALFENIARDPRHTDVRVLKREPIERRSFPYWSMAFVHVAPDASVDFGFGDGGAEPRDLAATIHDLIALHVAEAGQALTWPGFEDEA
jgi:hypothetical protein